MKSQSSVGKRIIWAVSMVVLCTFSTFLMSIFIQKAFPDMNIIYRGGIPVLIFVILGVASFVMQEYFLPFMEDLSIPEELKNAIPILMIGLGVLMMQFYYDENRHSAFVTEIYQNFTIDRGFFDVSVFGFESIYQYGLNVCCILLGYTVFAVSIYNRIYILASTVLIYLALKNFTRKSVSSILFIVFFLFGQQIFKLGVFPDAGVVYLLLCSIFIYIISLVFYYRTRKKNVATIVITQFLAVALFIFMVFCEVNSMILALPMIAVFFSGQHKQEKKIYYLSSMIPTLVVITGLVVMFVTNPMMLLKFSFSLPDIHTINYNATMLVLLVLIGFTGIYGMWSRSLIYLVPAYLGVYLLFVNPDFSSGINSELSIQLCLALYAALGIDSLGEPVKEDDDEKEMSPRKKITASVTEQVTDSITISEPVVTKATVMKEETRTSEEIDAIKAMNEKLNRVEQGFVPMTFKKPKRQEKQALDYAYEPAPAEMKYDIEIAENDDFDI